MAAQDFFAPDYEERREEALFYRRSYLGGDAYKEGRYLIRRPLESEERYEERCEAASYANYCAPIIDAYIDYLMGSNIHRDFGSLANSPILESFLSDADGAERGYHDVMTDAARDAAIEGWCVLVVDMPREEALTQAEAMAKGLRPYIAKYRSTDVARLDYVRQGWRRVLARAVLIEPAPEDEPVGTEVFRVWYPDRWELWVQLPGGEPEMVDEGVNPLGELPLVLVRNKDGQSDLRGIAELNRRIYQIDADIDEVRAMTAFPFLAVPERQDDEGNIIVVGAGNALPYDPEQKALPQYIEPTHTSIAVMLEERKSIVEDIQRLSRLGGDIVGGYKQAESGVALEIRFQQLNSLLRAKGRQMERAEQRVLHLFSRWLGAEFDGRITYPEQYGIRDVSAYLDNAAKALATVPSQAFQRALALRIASRVLGSDDPELMAEIERELSKPRVQDMVQGGGQ